MSLFLTWMDQEGLPAVVFALVALCWAVVLSLAVMWRVGCCACMAVKERELAPNQGVDEDALLAGDANNNNNATNSSSNNNTTTPPTAAAAAAVAEDRTAAKTRELMSPLMGSGGE
jgi:hypothetical protein